MWKLEHKIGFYRNLLRSQSQICNLLLTFLQVSTNSIWILVETQPFEKFFYSLSFAQQTYSLHWKLWARCGGSGLESQQLGGRGRRVKSLRSPSAIGQYKANVDNTRPHLEKKKEGGKEEKEKEGRKDKVSVYI